MSGNFRHFQLLFRLINLLAVTVHGERLCERAAFTMNALRNLHQDMTLAIFRQALATSAEDRAMRLGKR